jgi:uncharacterized protein YjbI with pentapeptide repeats
LPEEKRKVKLANISYDFRSVWFPANIDLSGYKFAANAYFISAAFSSEAYFSTAVFSDADFRWVAFSGNASFNETVFSSDADFIWTTFSDKTYFILADFSDTVYFNDVAFLGNAYFSEAVFQKIGNFGNTTFFSIAGFNKTEFLETLEIFFRITRFCSDIEFGQTMFEGFVSFEGNSDEKIFLDKDDVGKIRAELKARVDEFKRTLPEGKIEFTVPDAFTDKAEYDLRNAGKKEQGRASLSATNWTCGLIIFETILGPLQTALLALTIRRRFMR